MEKYSVYAYLSEIVEADDQFEAERKGLEIIERHGIRVELIEEEEESDDLQTL